MGKVSYSEKSTQPAKAKRSKPKQERLPGEDFKVERHPDVNKAAELYVQHRDERMQATEIEVESRDNLVAAMRKHGLKEYRDPDSELLVVLIEGKTKVKVRTAAEDDEAEEP